MASGPALVKLMCSGMDCICPANWLACVIKLETLSFPSPPSPSEAVKSGKGILSRWQCHKRMYRWTASDSQCNTSTCMMWTNKYYIYAKETNTLKETLSDNSNGDLPMKPELAPQLPLHLITVPQNVCSIVLLQWNIHSHTAMCAHILYVQCSTKQWHDIVVTVGNA